MEIISHTPDTILITLNNHQTLTVSNVISIKFVNERYIDCSTVSADLNEIQRLLNTQKRLRIKLWNNQTVTAVEYVHGGTDDDLLLDTGELLSKTYAIPYKNPTRIAYAIFGYWQNI